MKRKVVLVLEVNDNSDEPNKMWSAEEEEIIEAVEALDIVTSADIIVASHDTESMEIYFSNGEIEAHF